MRANNLLRTVVTIMKNRDQEFAIVLITGEYPLEKAQSMIDPANRNVLWGIFKSGCTLFQKWGTVALEVTRLRSL